MNISENLGRWPPAYDFAELGEQIKKIIDDGSIHYQFFQLQLDDSSLFQGDVLSFQNNPYYIDKDGDISAIDEDYDYWIILGNTCDLARELPDDNLSGFPHLTHISPLIPLPEDIPAETLDSLKKYKLYKKVFIPNWEDQPGDFLIDLTLITSVEKKCLEDNATILARLHFKTWLLLHSCLVRYLARDDGRND